MTRRHLMMTVGALVLSVGPAATATPNSPSVDFEQIIDWIEREGLSEAEARELIERLEQIKERAKNELTFLQRAERALLNPWVAFGFLAQFAFMMRFVVQLVASERKKRSYVPIAFWYLSLAGGTMLFVYALKLRDPVFVLGQGLGCFIYVRNLVLIRNRKGACRGLQDARRERAVQGEPETAGKPTDPDATGPAPPRTSD